MRPAFMGKIANESAIFLKENNWPSWVISLRWIIPRGFKIFESRAFSWLPVIIVLFHRGKLPVSLTHEKKVSIIAPDLLKFTIRSL